MNKEKNEFLEACRTAMAGGTFRQAVFALDGKGKNKSRAKFERLAGDTRSLVRYTNSKTGAEQVSGFQPETVYMTMRSADITPFQSATLYTEEFDLHYAENRKREPRLYKSKASIKGQTPEHNRQKNYILAKDRPWLQGLGIAGADGAINKSQYGKFRQIANFVEIIDRSIGGFVAGAEGPVNVLDLGCGKGYLTFAVYDYIRTRAAHEPHVRGVDIKTNVIELCNGLASEFAYNGLSFRNARIEPEQDQKLDILIALHACDTATDDALALGIRSGMSFCFCAPCCQAEIAAQMTASENGFGLVARYPLMRRRQADIITDVARALLLNVAGYETRFLEFTALEHTSKNVLLTALKSNVVDREKARRDYLELKKACGFTRHALEEHLRDML